MSTEKKPTIYDQVTNRIIEALESGTAPWTQPWKTTVPCNAETKREYHGINKLLLWLVAQENQYASNGWLTYRQAQALGGQVRRGEKATPVIWWSKVAKSEHGNDQEKEQPCFWIARSYHVFNLEQVDGIEELRASLLTPAFDFHPLYKCERLLAEYSADIRHGGSEAFYSPLGDFIQMPLPERFESREAYYATLTHELVHHSGATHRLARNLTGKFGSDGYAREELVAEIGSAFLTASLGIPHQTRANAAYIASWLKVLRSDKRAIFDAAKLAQQACDFIHPTDVKRDVQSAA